jgi:DNA-binding SARP family transcriptional activator
MRGEPLRESTHRALIKLYLAEGNRAEALHQYDFFRELLHERLGLEPSGEMKGLLGSLKS